jgi:DNA-binding response OmpR family regulator
VEILLIEDEASLMQSMVLYLEMEGFKCIQAVDYHTAVKLMDKHDYVCLLIDLNLPDGDGIDLVKAARRNMKSIGIIIISARNAIEQRIAGLEAGADDYLVKPFHLSELVARVLSLIRRTRLQGDNLLNFGVLKVYPEDRNCYVNDALIELTNKEYELLLYFMSNRKRVITKESIAEYLWRDYSGGFSSYEFLYTHIKNLKKKLTDRGCPDYIKNVYGIGYKFTDE